MERCPACRGRLRGQHHCSRCGCDLSLPIAIELQAQRLEGEAISALVNGQRELAQSRLLRARRLHASTFSQSLLSFLETTSH